MSGAADTLGGRLKAGREHKGFSTQKAADELHLDPWVIDALESGDYARIGPAVYGKGHLKRYAALLDLPADEVLLLYDTRVTAPATATPAATLRMPAEETAGGGRSLAAWGAGLALVLIIALFAVWRPWQPRSQFDAPTAAVSAPAPEPGIHGNADEPEAGVRPAAAEGSTDVPRRLDPHPAAVSAIAPTPASGPAPPARAAALTSGASAGPAAEPPAALGRARLKLSFSADSWVDVHDATGRRLFAGHGRANSVKTLAGAAPLSVYLGFASGVQLEVNNHAVAIGPQFLAGDVARFEAGADGVLRRDAHTSATAANPHPRG